MKTNNNFDFNAAMQETMQKMMQETMQKMMFGMFANTESARNQSSTEKKPDKQAQTEFSDAIDISYIIEKTVAEDGKSYYRVRIKNYRDAQKDGTKVPYLTKFQKMLINQHIKAMDGRREFQFRGDNGKKFNGYGYPKKADAEKAVQNLKTHFSAEEMTKFAKSVASK